MFKRTLSLFLCFLMIFSVGSVAFAAEPESDTSAQVEPRYKYCEEAKALLTGPVDNRFTGYVDIIGFSSCTGIQINVAFEKKGLVFWGTVGDYEWFRETGTTEIHNKFYTQSDGPGEYRLKADVKAFSGTKKESYTIKSPVVTVA